MYINNNLNHFNNNNENLHYEIDNEKMINVYFLIKKEINFNLFFMIL